MKSSILTLARGATCDRCRRQVPGAVRVQFGGKGGSFCFDCLEDRCVRTLPRLRLPAGLLRRARELGRLGLIHPAEA